MSTAAGPAQPVRQALMQAAATTARPRGLKDDS
jgi:hypothetical protein